MVICLCGHCFVGCCVGFCGAYEETPLVSDQCWWWLFVFGRACFYATS